MKQLHRKVKKKSPNASKKGHGVSGMFKAGDEARPHDKAKANTPHASVKQHRQSITHVGNFGRCNFDFALFLCVFIKVWGIDVLVVHLIELLHLSTDNADGLSCLISM